MSLRRALELLLAIGLGWVLAKVILPPDMIGAGLLGTVLGAMAWVGYDNWRAQQLMTWLADPTKGAPPDTSAQWGEIGYQVRKHIKALQRKARKSDARLTEFLAAIQASPNGVMLVNKTHHIEWANATAQAHLGVDNARDLGLPLLNLLRDPAFVAYYQNGQFAQAVEVPGAENTPSRPQTISVHIHPYGKGRKLLLSRDVTVLQQAEAMRRDFVANVTHEIRTPLTVLNGFIETLNTLPLSHEEQRRYLALMNQQSERMLSLVSDLLTLSGLENGPMPDEHQWVDGHALLHEAAEEAHALSKHMNPLGHVWHLPDSGVPEIVGSHKELHSALLNLLSNAVRYTPAGGRIEAGWRESDEHNAVFYVQDSGPGIAAEHLPRLTERFYRVDQSRSRETGGTGLGLAIVKHVALRHGGSLHIDSVVGQGSTFSLVFPASRVLWR